MEEQKKESKQSNPPMKEVVGGLELDKPKTNEYVLDFETIDDLQRPVMARMRDRAEYLDAQMSSKTTVLRVGARRVHKTIPPKIHGIKPERRLESPNHATLTYAIYKKAANGNKENIVTSVPSLSGKDIPFDASPIVEKVVVEHIESRKPIRVEEYPGVQG